MSSEIAYLLRLQSQATKELKTTSVNVFGDPAIFTSRLTSGYTRKGFAAYNNSDSGSGEVVWGGSDLTAANGIPLPKGETTVIPCSTDLDIYFCNTLSGEICNLRIMETA